MIEAFDPLSNFPRKGGEDKVPSHRTGEGESLP